MSTYKDMQDDLDNAEREWREVSRVAENVAEAIEQAKDALDAELTREALEDALSNWRLIDYSGPDSEVTRLKELDRLESALDEMLSEAQSGDTDDEDDDEDEPDEAPQRICDDDLSDEERHALMGYCAWRELLATEVLLDRHPDGHVIATGRDDSKFDLTVFRNLTDIGR